MNTSGYGGKIIREAVRVRTNDPERPYLGLVVTGFVDVFADLSKKNVRLSGLSSDRLSDQIVITPREGYPFIIEDMKARDGRHISFEIKEELDHGKNRYVLTIENIRKEKGTYQDMISIFTSSKLKKIIPIYVLGDIREAK